MSSAQSVPLVDEVANTAKVWRQQNDVLAEQRTKQDPLIVGKGHTIVCARKASLSWLSFASNPISRLIRSRLSLSTLRHTPEQQAEDDRLARVAATHLLPPQCRVTAPNTVLVVVVGCGEHGLNIAGELLRRGCFVRLKEVTPAETKRARLAIHELLQHHATKGLLLESDVDHLMTRCAVADSLDASLDGCQQAVLIEAVPDSLEIKQALFCAMVNACARCGLTPENVLLCSNTLTIPIDAISAALLHPYAARLIGVRFLFPCWFVDMIEVSLPGTSPHPTLGNQQWLAVNEVTRLLHTLKFKPIFIAAEAAADSGGLKRRRLLYEEACAYAIRQQVTCASDQAQQALEAEAEPSFLDNVTFESLMDSLHQLIQTSVNEPSTTDDDGHPNAQQQMDAPSIDDLAWVTDENGLLKRLSA